LRIVSREVYKALKILPFIFMVAGFGLVQFNRTANLHYHLDEYGILVAHSHPYNKSADTAPVKAHGNGKLHMSIPAGPSEMPVSEVACFALIIPVTIFRKMPEAVSLRLNHVSQVLRGRAPPVVTIF